MVREVYTAVKGGVYCSPLSQAKRRMCLTMIEKRIISNSNAGKECDDARGLNDMRYEIWSIASPQLLTKVRNASLRIILSHNEVILLTLSMTKTDPY